MNHKIILFFVLVCSILSSAENSEAGSIWAKKNKDTKAAYLDGVARKIGDVLTITISETSTVGNTSARNMEKKTSRSANFDGKVGIDHLVTSVPAFNFGTGTEYKNNFDSKANYSDVRSFTDSITAVVIDIMPNGNLVVMGTCQRNIADDLQTVEVNGIVRPEDIGANNTVSSERIANFSIITRYSGIAAVYNNPNWLGRIFDVIWPF